MTASAQKQTPSQNACCCTTTLKETTYSDSSGVIFSMYIDRAQKFDDEDVENWKGGADSILVFTGIFSATVATFIAMSYPLLQQDPNAPTTQSLLIKISQQLANPNGTIPPASPFDQSSFAPAASVVFINSVWFLSLVLSLTCALIATLLQQWARRYLQMVQRNHPPHERAHIREYFSQGARRFRIFGLVEALPFLLLVSVLLFFGGLVAFAFLANRTAACITAAIVGFCILSYIALTLLPLIYHDCPYHTPFTSLIWYTTRFIPLSCLSLAYRVTDKWYRSWGSSDKKGIVKSLHERQQKWAKSFSDGRISSLESSARAMLPSMGIYKKTLVRTLNWLTEDRELEKFVDGIPGLYESEALATMTRENGDKQRATIRDVLADLPGPTSFHPSLPWSIVQLAHRAFTSKLPESVRHTRTRACLKALYYIPGAICDVLAPYAAEENHSSKILPLLSSPESLEVINELQNVSNDDFTIPARCVAAVVAAYMITLSPPPTPNDFFIGDHESGKEFLGKRLGVDANPDDGANPTHRYRRDSMRLKNIEHFLKDIKVKLGELNKQWWTSKNAELIRKERDARTEEYRTSPGKLDQRPEGNRTSPAFVPAAQLDLVALTLKILVRSPATDATESQREALRDAYKEFKKVAFTQAVEEAKKQRLAQGTWIEAQAADDSQTVLDALGRLLPQTNTVQAADHVTIEVRA